MIRLIIVDDESTTRNGLLRHINWESLGVGMIQAAASGQEALAICETFQPDIILSDIRMRGMDGIEMCTILQRKHPQVKIIFISGYSDKAYFKAAIELGAVNYVEKPVNAEEVNSAVTRAIAEINKLRKQKSDENIALQNKVYLKRKVFFDLLEEKTLEPAVLRETEEFPLYRQTHFRVAILRAAQPVTNINRFLHAIDEKIPDPLRFQIHMYREFRDNRTLAMLFSGAADRLGDQSDLIHSYRLYVENEPTDTPLFFALGTIVTDILALHESYREAKQVEATVFYRGYRASAVRRRENLPILITESHYAAFSQALVSGEMKRIESALLAIGALLKQAQATQNRYVNHVYFSLERQLSQKLQQICPEEPTATSASHTGMERQDMLDTIDGFHQFLLERAHRLVSLYQEEKSNNSIIPEVIRIILMQYGNPALSVKQLAHSVYLTPTYLSSLFKRKTGVTIGEYLTEVRIERAKEQLKDKSHKLYQVASAVGYEDPNYFAKIFKKRTGLTPSEYRERG